MEVSERMRDEVVLHSWKMMKLDRCKVSRGIIDNYKFPNGIVVYWNYVGRRPLKVKSNVEQEREVESVMSDRDYKKKSRRGMVEFSVPYPIRGEYLDLLWDLYSVGIDWAF